MQCPVIFYCLATTNSWTFSPQQEKQILMDIRGEAREETSEYDAIMKLAKQMHCPGVPENLHSFSLNNN
jgi:hypothetical protein